MSRARLARVIRREAPGYRIVPPPPPVEGSPRPDAVSPELDEIRRRYGVGAVRARDEGAPGESNSEIVLIEPTALALPGAQPKGVVISKGRIIGRQG